MSSNPKVSIIVPCYNEEKYLYRCLHSLSMQTYMHIEVIVIDDGSDDNSLSVARSFEHKFDYVKSHAIKRSGIGQARNTGMGMATGEYLTFLDADDFMEPDMISLCVEKALRDQLDLVICNHASWSEDGRTEFKTGWHKDVVSITDTRQLAYELYSHRLYETVWGKLFKSAIAKDIPFINHIWFEDRPFMLEYLLRSDRVGFIERKLLKNFRRENSITRRTIESKRIVDSYKVYMAQTAIVQRYGVFDNYKRHIVRYTIDNFLFNYLILLIDEKRVKELSAVRKTFLRYLRLFYDHQQSTYVHIPLKSRIKVMLMFSPQWIGWSMANLLHRQFYPTLYKKIYFQKYSGK